MPVDPVGPLPAPRNGQAELVGGPGRSLRWLLGIIAFCLLGVLGLKLFFADLQEDLRARSENERARLFVGEEIVRGIHDIEKNIYQLVATTNAAGLARVQRAIGQQLAKLEHDLGVLQNGGVVRREVKLNLEGRDETIREAHYRPDSPSTYVMEIIEISPQLDLIRGQAGELGTLIGQRHDCLESRDRACLLEVLPRIAAFLKQVPSHFERLDENANRLFFDSSERLRQLEIQLKNQRDRLTLVEMTLIAMVVVLAGLATLLFMRRINQANDRLAAALTEMRAARDEAEAAKDAAVSASHAKSQFVSRMSHELRTPLNAIIGFAQLLEAEPLSPSHLNYVQLINNSGNHLMELINAVLDHAKIEAGGLTLEDIAFDLPATVEAVRIIIAERATHKGLDFVAAISADLPRHVMGDPTRLRQVLINLLVNAVKFTEQGSVELRVAVEDDRIVFSIRDSGIGMDQAAREHLFQPFSQADSSITRKYGGTGLGLIISKELIEAMGGAIDIDSAPGVGTCFWFWLPLRIAQTLPGNDGDPAPAGPSSLSDLVPGRILLVDDNRVNQQLAGAMLTRLSLDHDCADNGVEALRRIADSDYALVLMDMEMPVMDGVTATQQIRAAEVAQGRPRLPIIAMTANAMQEDRERCFAAGMDGYIAKPIVLNALHNELRRLFATKIQAEAERSNDRAEPRGKVFDRAAAVDMMGDEALFDELAALFVTDGPTYLRDLEEALAEGDWPRLARAAHTLKGLFATFAAAEGQAQAQQLEAGAHAGDAVRCRELAPSVAGQANRLIDALAAGSASRPA
jgi:signal transduction histidine kinase/CheY-like chemotaxis protein/HPt (histidine-containing phosphotransfer) domain-containing protein